MLDASAFVEEFVQFHKGAGVQHLAVLCDDICQTVQMLRTRGVQFLNVPDTYYDMLSDRIGEVGDQLKQLRESRVLLDRDEWGDLLQTFSTPVTGRPTLFFELIQRNGRRGFGSGNIRALFEAVEREQAARAGW